MEKQTGVLVVAILLVGAVIGAGAVAVASNGTTDDTADGPGEQTFDQPIDPLDAGGGGNSTLLSTDGDASVEQFDSPEAFQSYLRQGQMLTETSGRFLARPTVAFNAAEEREMDDNGGADMAGDGATASTTERSGAPTNEPDRVSDTNVQEQGLDEPDILKNDGRNIYYAPQDRYQHRPRGEGDVRRDGHGTHVLSAADPGQPERIGGIDSNGRMVLSGDTLVVIEEEQLLGYDVSDPAEPEERWTQPLNSSVVTARLYDGQFYLVTRERVSQSEPCPIEPMGGEAAISCTEVYHPSGPAPVDATYSAMAIDPATGEVGSTTSFVGTSDNTAVYMSENALYVTYTQTADRGQLRIDFLLDTQSDRLPAWVTDRLQEIRGYNISSEAKRMEANRVLHQWYRNLDDNQREVLQENVRNDYRDYLADRQRDLVRTGVVQVDVGDGDLSVENVGEVPGRPLNQFSLDEHDGTFRITTTIPGVRGQDSRNDLYVLDSDNLDRMGAQQNMGLNERVFSVRYVGDTAYVVTFRRIDPFHVVDLSDPNNPEEVGELKLPGFSSYLHPIDDDRVLGIGEEDGQVKAVMFDVSDPSNPTVQDDYILNSGWSAVAESHHAFLLDRQHGVFFLPTGNGGNVIDYTDGELTLETRINTDGPAFRAMYVNDYMYVFGQEELAVVDETTWDRTHTVALDGD